MGIVEEDDGSSVRTASGWLYHSFPVSSGDKSVEMRDGEERVVHCKREQTGMHG